MVLLVLEENDLLQCVNEKVPKPEAVEDKLLSLQETSLGCSSSMPGNLKCF